MNPLQRFITDRTPDGWETRPFWSLFQRVKKTGYADEELLSVYRDYGVIPKSSRDDNHNKESEDLSGYQLVDKGYLVTNKMKAWQGSIAVSRYRGIVSPAYYVYKPLSNEHDQFLHYLLRSENYIALYGRISKGVRVNQWDLEHEALRNIPVLLPPQRQQKEIADFLDHETARFDQLIDKKNKIIFALLERYHSFLNRVMTGKFSSEDFIASPNSMAVGQLPKDWSIRPLKTLVKIYGRIGFRGYTTQDMVDQGEGAITLSPSNIYEGEMTLVERAYLSWSKYYESPEIQVREGDILFVKTGSTIGKTAIVKSVPESMTLNPQLVLLREHKIDSLYLSYFLKSPLFQYQVSYNVFGGSTPAMSQSKLGRLLIAFPNNPAEQKRLASLIDNEKMESDKLISLVRKSIVKLNEIKTSLITEAVTGQLDIKAWQKRAAGDGHLDKIEADMQEKKGKKASA